MDGGQIFSALCISVSVVLLYVAVGFLTKLQGSENTRTEYRTQYAFITTLTIPLVTILFAALMGLLYYFKYFHYSFYIIPAVVAFSLSFAGLAISLVTFAA